MARLYKVFCPSCSTVRFLKKMSGFKGKTDEGVPIVTCRACGQKKQYFKDKEFRVGDCIVFPTEPGRCDKAGINKKGEDRCANYSRCLDIAIENNWDGWDARDAL